jgi:hypothetical protein
MKKTKKKLVLAKETVRVLEEGTDLHLATGGPTTGGPTWVRTCYCGVTDGCPLTFESACIC